MTLPIALDLMGAWEQSPPVHWMVAAYLGAGKKKGKKAHKMNDWSELAGMIPVTRSKKGG